MDKIHPLFQTSNEPSILDISTNGKALNYVENVAAAGGHDCAIRFTLPIQCTLNQRDQVGFLLLQNDESVVTLTMDVSNIGTSLHAARWRHRNI